MVSSTPHTSATYAVCAKFAKFFHTRKQFSDNLTKTFHHERCYSLNLLTLKA